MKKPVLPLRRWRTARNLTFAAAGDRIGVQRSTWHDWENGNRVPGPALMIELYTLTNGQVQPNDFYDLPDLPRAELAA